MVILSFRMPGEKRATLVVDAVLVKVAKRHLKRLGARKVRVEHPA